MLPRSALARARRSCVLLASVATACRGQADFGGLEGLGSLLEGLGKKGGGPGGAGRGRAPGGADDLNAGLNDLLSSLSGVGGAGGGAGRELCRNGQVPVPGPGSHRAFTANGCGPQGMQIKEPFGLHKCCNFHDICFWTCGTTHEWCEQEFKRCTNRICKKPLTGEPGPCRQQAQSFTGLTGAFGAGFHQGGQQASCRCVDPVEAPAAHRSYLTDFLEEYDPPEANDERIDALLSKWRGREGEMYVALVKKYGRKFVKFENVPAEFEERKKAEL